MNKIGYIFKDKGSRITNNKIGSSYWFIYTLLFGFVITILFIIFDQTLKVYLYPTTLTLTGGVTTSADKWLSFWGLMPFMIVAILGIFMFFKLTSKDTEEQ